MTHPHNEAPVNPLPPVVVALFLVLAVIELVIWLGGQGIVGGPAAVGWRTGMIESYGFSGRAFDWMLETGQFPPELLVRFVSYLFLHASFSHALFAMVILLAMGKIVTEALGSLAFVTIFFLSGIVGAVAFGVISDDPWLIGAFPSVYGLIGGFTFLLWMRLGTAGANQYRAFSLIGMLLAVQLVFGVFFGGTNDWIADIAGFIVGFGLTVVLAPGGTAGVVARIRRR
ncbi:rhomboid family intramembrane serine protease [Antarctobacter heliothermus]|uniref:Membrane associated serine protease, rhomboid family n=1 Tax=Antarctobacter heliothermus TaxID=74033 RepID=A0A239C0T8_9RHOB|nr:rhomboid family intramembrane serine protease [Antarctobacter heliothermus]SNS13857.1 Membrane associated serine protease, rhomboid family [Antarctobacter heliothermus]